MSNCRQPAFIAPLCGIAAEDQMLGEFFMTDSAHYQKDLSRLFAPSTSSNQFLHQLCRAVRRRMRTKTTFLFVRIFIFNSRRRFCNLVPRLTRLCLSSTRQRRQQPQSGVVHKVESSKLTLSLHFIQQAKFRWKA